MPRAGTRGTRKFGAVRIALAGLVVSVTWANSALAEKRFLTVLAVEPKGGTTVDKEPFPPSSLPAGGGYVVAKPDEKTGRWEVSSYVWLPVPDHRQRRRRGDAGVRRHQWLGASDDHRGIRQDFHGNAGWGAPRDLRCRQGRHLRNHVRYSQAVHVGRAHRNAQAIVVPRRAVRRPRRSMSPERRYGAVSRPSSDQVESLPLRHRVRHQCPVAPKATRTA